MFLKLASGGSRSGCLQVSAILFLVGPCLQSSPVPISHSFKDRVLKGHGLQYTRDMASWPSFILPQRLRSGEAQADALDRKSLLLLSIPLFPDGAREVTQAQLWWETSGGQAGSHSSDSVRTQEQRLLSLGGA